MENTMKLDDLPLFRVSDPDTSVQGADDVRLRQGTQAYKLLEQYVLHRQGLTDEEAGVFSGLASRGAGYWKRCSDLRRLGLIEDCQVRRQGASGSMMMVCVFTPAGFEVYQEAKA